LGVSIDPFNHWKNSIEVDQLLRKEAGLFGIAIMPELVR
jgi:hypothetical protein